MSKLYKYSLPILIVFLSISFCSAINNSEAIEAFTFEMIPGGAFTLPSRLFIYQDGYPDLKLTANYKTQSFNLPFYYSVRIGTRLTSSSMVELEMNHLKITLNNKPTEIDHFSITHGFNQIWFNHKYQSHNWHIRTGVGPVIAHPESIIRGKQLEGNSGIVSKGYYIAGITTQFSVQRKFNLGKHLFLSIESKANVAYARVPIVDGFAKVPVFAFHGLCGIGCSF